MIARPTHRTKQSLAASCVAALILAAPAAANTNQESLVQDDPLVLGARNQGEADNAFRTFKAIGADRVDRKSVV